LLGAHEDPLAADPGRVDGRADGRVIEADAGLKVELPAVPGTAKHPPAAEGVRTGRTLDALDQGAEAEGPAVVRAAVADTVEGAARVANDSHIPPANARDEMAVPLEVSAGADVYPVTHAATSPSRSP
jgi:hypothetical protein